MTKHNSDSTTNIDVDDQEHQIIEFYMHASSLDRMRLRHQLEILRERAEN